MPTDLLSFLFENVPQFRSTRIPALYSDFSLLRTTNPDGYNANVSAWLQGLTSATRAGVIPTSNQKPNLLSLSIDQDLILALETEHGRPLSLGTVVREGIAKGQLHLRQEFLEAEPNIYRRSWPLRPWTILTRGLRQLRSFRNYDGQDDLPVEDLVILENLEIASEEAKKRFSSLHGRSQRVFTRTEFVESFSSLISPKFPLSESDMELFLKFLARDKALISYNSETVKLRSPNSTVAITSEDTTISSIKNLIADLTKQIVTLTHKHDELSASAKSAVSKNNRAAALAALKSKNLTNKTLTKRYTMLAQLEEVFTKIEQASDQVELVNIMEASTQILLGLNKEIQGPERVDKVVDQLRDQMQLVDEFQFSPEVDQAVDEDELELELADIERDENEKKSAIARDQELFAHELENKKLLNDLEEVGLQVQDNVVKCPTEPTVQKELDQSIGLLENLSLAVDANTASQ